MGNCERFHPFVEDDYGAVLPFADLGSEMLPSAIAGPDAGRIAQSSYGFCVINLLYSFEHPHVADGSRMPCLGWERAVPDITDLADQYRVRAQEVRTIALGIFDCQERKTVMEFADDYERLAREVKGRLPNFLVASAPRFGKEN